MMRSHQVNLKKLPFFGKLLLNHFRYPPSTSKKKNIKATFRKVTFSKKRTLIFKNSFISQVTLPPHQKPQLPQIIPSAPLTKIPPLEPPFSGELYTHHLIRPNERLRLSIEGFLLDQRSPHTCRAYSKDLKRLVQFLLVRQAERGKERIERTLFISYKDALLSESLEHTTIDRHLATLRSFFRWLVDDGHLLKNPMEGVRFLNPKRLSRTQAFSDAEVQKILSLPDLHMRTGAQHYAILIMLFYCGLRRSEICSLRTSQLGEERGQKVIQLKGKGNTERLIVLIPAVWNALKYYFLITQKDWKQDQYLFTPNRNNRTGQLKKPLDPSMIFYIVVRYAKQAGVMKRVSPHSCRATAISNARDHHVPDRAIQEFAGWSTPAMITRYDKRKTAVEKSAAHAISYGVGDRSIPNPS